jgi:hypothetical protein
MSDNPLSGGLLNSIAHPQGLSPNLLSAYGAGQDIAGKMWGNREWQAKQAVGEAQQAAIDPKTGEFSPELFRKNLQQAGPVAALSAQSGLGATQTISDAQLAQVEKKLAWVNATAGAVLQSGDFSDASMMSILQRGLAGGMLTMAEVQRQMSTMPADPQGRERWLREHQMTAASTQQQLEQTYGSPGSVNNGQQVQPGVIAPPIQGGGFRPGGAPVQTYPSRSELLTQQPGVTSTGAPTATPLAGQAANQGRGDLTGPAGRAPPPSPTNQPRLPVPGGPPAGSVVTGLSPTSTADNAADVANFKTAQAAVATGNASIQNLQHAYEALRLTNSGKSTETTHAMYSFLAAQGLLPRGLVDDVKNYDLFRKYTEKYAGDQGAASGTDAGRAMAVASNAGTSISTPANFEVLRNEIGRQRQQIAQVSEHKDQSGLGYGRHSAEFSGAVDQRGFAADMFTPAELNVNDPKSMLGKMTPAERARFFKAAAIAHRSGMLNLPGAAP